MNLRTHLSKAGTLFLAGRTDETNEILMAQIQDDEIVLHTKLAGSPFVNIKGQPKEGDLQEAAVFCARYSRDWKKNNTDVTVHYFLGKNTYKNKDMKSGTFGVKNTKIIQVKKEDILNFKVKPVKIKNSSN